MKKPISRKEIAAHKRDTVKDFGTGNLKIRRNRFAKFYDKAKTFVIKEDGTRQEIRTVHIDEEVSRIFNTSESINTVLRAFMSLLPKRKGQRIAR